MADYDAFLLVSFGGPEGPDDVMPFLQNVTRGRGIPPERLEAVAEHYYAVGGVSPINQQCRDLIAAIGKDFAAAGVDLPIYWGNRNWDPYLTDDRGRDGRRRGAARAGLRHLGLRVLLQLPAVPGRHRAGPGRGRPGRPADRQDPALLQPPRLHRAVRGRHPAGHRDAAGRGPRGRPARVHRAQRAGGHGRGQRAAARRPLPGAAGRGGRAHRGPGQRRAPAAGTPGGWSTRAAAGRPRSPGSAPTSATTWRSWPGTGRRARSWSRSGSSPTTWRSCTTWTSRRPQLAAAPRAAAGPGGHPGHRIRASCR